MFIIVEGSTHTPLQKRIFAIVYYSDLFMKSIVSTVFLVVRYIYPGYEMRVMIKWYKYM